MENKSSILKVKNYFRKLIACPPVSWRAHRSSLIAQDGFTLIETIMVMVIIAILAVAIVVRNPFDAIKLSSAARKVAGDIRYVQKLSISNQTRAGIVFNAASNAFSYSVYPNINAAPLAISPGDPCSSDASNNFVVDFTANRCSNYVGVRLDVTATTIAFDSLGQPVNAAGGAIGPETITVNYNGSQTITIAAGTGRVSIP